MKNNYRVQEIHKINQMQYNSDTSNQFEKRKKLVLCNDEFSNILKESQKKLEKRLIKK